MAAGSRATCSGTRSVDAAERGCESSTLVATKLGYPAYERLGFRPVGQISMWELRSGA